MADFVRKLVSGNKARFKDDVLDVDLDLSYITDQIIIMGYPASGIEGLYRNKRQDAQRFLQERHGTNFWVFNFCPVRENSYDKEVFGGRVSRWPFPDHHAPPLAVLPLVAKEINEWLQGSPERVAVLHCKAGKGRSGTLACAYIMSLPTPATGPQQQRSHTTKQWAKKHAENAIQQVERTQDEPTNKVNFRRAESPLAATEENPSLESKIPSTATLQHVLDLHSSRRMNPSKDQSIVRKGVSIPSQRRWLYYWSLILSDAAPTGYGGFWDIPPSPSTPAKPPQKIRITKLTMRIRKASSLKLGLLHVANALVEKTASSTSVTPPKKVWASLARYNDDLVDVLARVYRGEGDKLFEDDIRDKHKMVRSFKRLKAVEVTNGDASSKESNTDKKVHTYVFSPISDATFQKDIAPSIPVAESPPALDDDEEDDVTADDIASTPTLGKLSREPSIKEDTGDNNMPNTGGPSSTSIDATVPGSISLLQPQADDSGVVVEAHREMRIKLYMGQMFLAWAWIVPLFHMPPIPQTGSTSGTSSSPSPSEKSNSGSTNSEAVTKNVNGGRAGSHASPDNPYKTTLVLSMEDGAKELDFAIGVGSGILDLSIDMEWVQDGYNTTRP